MSKDYQRMTVFSRQVIIRCQLFFSFFSLFFFECGKAPDETGLAPTRGATPPPLADSSPASTLLKHLFNMITAVLLSSLQVDQALPQLFELFIQNLHLSLQLPVEIGDRRSDKPTRCALAKCVCPALEIVDEHFAHPLINGGALWNGGDFVQCQLQKPHFSLLRCNLAAGEVDLLLGRGRLAFDLPDELRSEMAVSTRDAYLGCISLKSLRLHSIRTDAPFRARRLGSPS